MPIQILQPEFIRPIYIGTWAGKPSAAGNGGKEIIVTDLNGSHWRSNNEYWAPVEGWDLPVFKPGSRVVYDSFYEDFETLAGQRTSSGDTWVASGAGTGSVSNGSLMASGNFYAYLDYGEPITEIYGVFSFLRNPTGSNDRTISTHTMIADSSLLGLGTMLHLLVGPNGWNLQKRIAGGSFISILAGASNLAPDGSVYSIGIRIAGNTATVITPEGAEMSVTDTDIGGINARYGCWQIPVGGASNGSGFLARWNAAILGPVKASAQRALGRGAAAGDVKRLFGEKLSSRQQLVNVPLTSGAGWYRIATSAVEINHNANGRLLISANDGLRTAFAEVSISSAAARPGIYITQHYCNLVIPTGGIPFSKIRVSRNGSTLVAVDLYIPNATALNLWVDAFGTFTLDETPNYNPTVLATEEATLDFLGGREIGRQVINGSVADISTSYLDAPSTGFTATIPNECNAYIVDPAGTLATGTITMPAAPLNGQRVSISTTQTITALTLSPNTGHTIANAPTTLAAGSTVAFRYRSEVYKWLPG